MHYILNDDFVSLPELLSWSSQPPEEVGDFFWVLPKQAPRAKFQSQQGAEQILEPRFICL